jgi:hypothetical protein
MSDPWVEHGIGWKGNRVERELVALHREVGIFCERYPLSGASRFRGSAARSGKGALGRVSAPGGEEDHEQIDEAIGDISGESCASLLGVFEGPTLREECKYSGGGVK